MEPAESIKVIADLKNEVHNKNGILLNLYISGSDLYGWRSNDSDVDIRGTYILDKREFLGLKTPKDTLQIKGYEDYDIDLFEIKKSLQLALKSNCTVLEGYYAPQIYATKEYTDIAEKVKELWGKQIFAPYKGMAEHNYRKFIAQGRNTVKKYLYVFRSLLAGRYALDNGIIESDMGTLAQYYRVDVAKKLLKIKKAGKENEPLKDLDSGVLDDEIIKQFAKLEQAKENSKLPDGPSPEQKREIENKLINMRLEMFRDR